MTANSIRLISDSPPSESPQAKVEMALIEAYLAGKGYRLRDLHLLPTDVARTLMTEASVFASSKLAEIETRSRLVFALHGNF